MSDCKHHLFTRNHAAEARLFAARADRALLRGEQKKADHLSAVSIVHDILAHASGPFGVVGVLKFLRIWSLEKSEGFRVRRSSSAAETEEPE